MRKITAVCPPVLLLVLLWGCGPDTNVKYRTLYMAASDGDAEDVKKHLRRGDKIDEANVTYEWTPLHKAAASGYTDVVEVLLSHGANTTLKDIYGKTALDYAKEQNFEKIVALFEKHAGDKHTPPG